MREQRKMKKNENKTPLYKDKTKSPRERANDLLSRLTLEEKINQMVVAGMNEIDEYADRLDAGEKFMHTGIHSFLGHTVEAYNRMQSHIVNDFEHGIPVIVDSEDTHGVCHPDATIYPTSGCLAATFDEKYAYLMGKYSGKEAAALGIRHLYAPNVDISRDPRWGRTEENYGEDPLLSGNMGTELVKGIQSQKVAAGVKHYIAYGIGEGGLNLAPAHIGEREIREAMLPPFEDCIKKGKVWSVMPSYNEIDGEPVHASKKWMVDVLRKELGFDGLVITDYSALLHFKLFHRICETPLEAAKIALENQIDLEACGAFAYGEELYRAVKAGEIPEKMIDDCVRRVLELKFKTELFDKPCVDKKDAKNVHNEKCIALAREIAEKGIVLLKNDGVLPFKGVEKVAVVGPNSDVTQLGDFIYYSLSTGKKGVSDDCDSLKTAFEKKFGAENVFSSRGCDYVFPDENELKKAVEAANKADVVVLALGDNSRTVLGGNQGPGKPRNPDFATITSGEGLDMHYIELPPAQRQLFDEMKKTGKPVVVVLYGGKPHAVTKEAEQCSAMIQAFGPGEEGSGVLVDIMTGKVCPSGKLPFSFPRSTGHIPAYYNHKPSARGSLYRTPGSETRPGWDYVLASPEPLFPFGFGLSYTTFEYKDLSVRQTGKKKMTLNVTVANTGDRAGDESVLVFLSCAYRRITPEVKKLVAYKRISLEKGEEKTLSFTLTGRAFDYIDTYMRKRTAYGEYEFFVGDKKTKCILDKGYKKDI